MSITDDEQGHLVLKIFTLIESIDKKVAAIHEVTEAEIAKLKNRVTDLEELKK